MAVQVLGRWQPPSDAAERLLGTQLPSLQRVSRSCEDVQLLVRHTEAHRARRRADEAEFAEEGQRRQSLAFSSDRPSLVGDDGGATASAGGRLPLGGDSTRRDGVGSGRRPSMGAERRQSVGCGSGRRDSLAGGSAVARDVADAFVSGEDVLFDPHKGTGIGWAFYKLRLDLHLRLPLPLAART